MNEMWKTILTYSTLKAVSCWKVLDSILLIWLCCKPLLRKKTPRITTRNVKQTTGLDFDECKLCRFKLLTSPEVRSSGKSLADSQSGCKTAPCNDAKSFWHKHNDQLWVYSVGNDRDGERAVLWRSLRNRTITFGIVIVFNNNCI